MYKRFLTFLGIVILLLVLPLSLVSNLRNAAIRIVQPVASKIIHNTVGVHSFITTLRQIATLHQDKLALQDQVISLQQKLITFQEVTRENEALRKELGVTGVSQNYQKVLAHVIVHGIDVSDQTFTVDVGSKNGVQIGQPAVYQGALVGKVISVSANSAVVRLIISQESRVQVWITESREKGLLIGDGSQAYLSDITQGIDVPSQSVVETSGLGGSLPQGIIVGQVGKLRSKKSDLSQSFDITLPEDPTNLETVFILLTTTQ